MAHREVLSTHYPERVDQVLRMTLKAPDANGVLVPIPLSDMTAITFTLYNTDAAQTIINSRSDTNVLNTGPGTYHATSGLLTIALAAADMAIVGSDSPSSEIHVALIEYTYGGGKSGVQEVQMTVTNIAKRP